MTNKRENKRRALVFAALAGALGLAVNASPVAAADMVVMGTQAVKVQPIQPTQPTQPANPTPPAQPTPPVGSGPADSFNPVAKQPHMAKEKPKTETYLSISLKNVLVTGYGGAGNDGKSKDNDTKDQQPQPSNTPPPPQNPTTPMLRGADDLMSLDRAFD